MIWAGSLMEALRVKDARLAAAEPRRLPPPLWGRVGVGGREVVAQSFRHSRSPPPTPPRKGEGRSSRPGHGIIHRLQSSWGASGEPYLKVTGVGSFLPAKYAVRMPIVSWPIAVSTVAMP